MENTDNANWRKSSHSDGDGNCVEVSISRCGNAVGVRDTKDRDGGTLEFTRAAWQDFIGGVRDSEFDR